MTALFSQLKLPHLSSKQFHRLSDFINKTTGISLPETKKTMLESRLLKRLRSLSFSSFDEYLSYAFDKHHSSDELQFLIDRATTHKTDFFREKIHFDILKEDIIPYWREHNIKNVKILSAACSTGEEVYSLAMLMAEQWTQPGEDFSIVGFDISSSVIESAKKAVYPIESIQQIEQQYVHKYLLRSKEGPPFSVRIMPELRKKAAFECWNILDQTIPIDDFHLVFCRNMLIYFSRKDQELITNRLLKSLHTHGFLVLGVSEPLMHRGPHIKPFSGTIYQKETGQ